MSNRPMESLKEIAAQLAHHIATGSNDRDKIQALAGELALTPPFAKEKNTGNPSHREIKNNPAREDGVGIWTASFNNGKKYYIRDLKYKNEFDKWARTHGIPPKGSKKRVVYLGESVSRGFLLDPFYTPASVLETLLNSEPGLLQAEVVDLARTDCTIDQLTELCTSCLALQPDLIVIFAGNNWINCFELGKELVEEIIRTMETGTGERFATMQRLFEGQYKDRISRFMHHVADLSKTHSIPIVYVIPEFNLKDFRSNWVQQINLWPGGETSQWLKLKEQILQAFKKGEIKGAEELSRKMISLNPGNPYGYEILARCYMQQDLFSEAEEYLRKALDTAMFRGQNVPCCISVIRKALLEESAKYGIAAVDLPEIFKQAQGGKPPDRELFLDYCHLSVEGIRVAMAAAAGHVIPILSGEEIPQEVLKTRAPQPPDEVTAKAHFFAAIHNAHRGEQPFAILLYHCRQALKKSMKIKDLMLNYVEMVTRHSVWSLSKWCEKMFESGEMTQFPYILQPHNHYIMDIDLVDAIASALEEHGIIIKDRVLELRKKEHGLINGKIDLLESYYHLSSYVASYSDNYYKAFSPQSRFFLVTGGEHDVELQLTYRVPYQNHKNHRVSIHINGSLKEEIPALNQWQNFIIKVPGSSLRDGINEIKINWPPEVRYQKEIGKRIHHGNGVEILNRMMYPAYGEIHMFNARIKN